MITRKLKEKLLELATYYPVVAVTGPRQAGKTTLCRATFPDKPYVSLESLDFREFARSDPRGFLAEYRQGAVLDEIQQVPELVSYVQSARQGSGLEISLFYLSSHHLADCCIMNTETIPNFF
jgi:uncharacterized protein